MLPVSRSRLLTHCLSLRKATPQRFSIPSVCHRQVTRSGSSSHDDHHHDHPVGYEPGGYLFGQPPEQRGQKKEKFWWENMWYFGYYGPFVVYFLFEYYSPKVGPHESFKLEAQKRMRERGETFDWPFPPDYCLLKEEKKE